MRTPRASIAAFVVAILIGGSCGAAIDRAGMDTTVSPGIDFNLYANGSWLKAAQIPQDRSSWGVFSILRETARQRTRSILEEAAAAHAPAGSIERKVGDFYASFMNESAVNARGLAPLQKELSLIARLRDKQALARYLGSTLRCDVDALNNTNFHTDRLFGLWVAPGFADPRHYTAYLLQGGLGVRSPDQLLKDTPGMREIREAYRTHIARILELSGSSPAVAKRSADLVLALEQAIASVHVSRADSEDVLKANNPWKREDFARLAPGLSWADFFAGAGLAQVPILTVWHPAATTGIAKLVASTPLETWKVYLRFHLIDRYSAELSTPFASERFAFYGKVVSGTPIQADRWKRAVDLASGSIGDAVGQLYVKRYFPPESKAAVEKMVAQIVQAFDERILNVKWMARSTREEARKKLKTLYVGIGYPETFIDYSKLVVRRADLLGNVERAERFKYARNVARLGKTVDRREWAMTPQTVNAVNLPLQNAINFPAAILEPPFFERSADAAQNFGAIGSIIGHEISHSFDDEGAKFDADGLLINWWTADDLKHFREAGEQLVRQFDAYHPLPDLAVNGALTLSENIADLAGLSAAFDAWRQKTAQRAGDGSAAMLGEREFFLSYAQAHRDKVRDAALREQLLTDGHAPDEYRAQTVRNIDAWYAAFDVQPGAALYLAPNARVRIW